MIFINSGNFSNFDKKSFKIPTKKELCMFSIKTLHNLIVGYGIAEIARTF